MSDQDTDRMVLELRRIEHALKRWEAKDGEAHLANPPRISFAEIMAATSGPAEVLFRDVPDEVRKCGALEL